MVAENSSVVTFRLPSDREIVMERVFDAPRALVFEAWTNPKHLAQWWGPRRFTNPVCEIDLRVGGAYRIVQRGPDGAEYPFKGEYREVVPPERLVYTQIFDVEPWSSHELVVTLTFDEHQGKTKLTSTSTFASLGDRDAMLATGMKDGAIETLERLAEYLPSMA